MQRLLPLPYFLFVSLPHHPFSDFFDQYILIPFGMSTVKAAVNALSVLLVAGGGLFVIRAIRADRRWMAALLPFWLLTLALIYVSDRILIVNNIERIHFVQYSGLVLLLRLSIRDNVLIFFAASFAGMLDEVLQYLMNPHRTSYLDFNDFVLNILGAAIGVLLLLTFERPRPDPSIGGGLGTPDLPYEARFKTGFRLAVGLIAALAAVAVLAGRVVAYAPMDEPSSPLTVIDGKLSFVISYEKHDGFWQRSYFGKTYHVLSLVEGMVVMVLLLAGYAKSFRWLRQKRTEPPPAT